ncbi:type II toxin-antitoxin system RelE/ParE family toxin [Glaciimonas sp. PAMC28666]|uniref:type II toxin-antitoxin system RelE/ParE family toxin n=1 Tax=Glaciimonas sp. PAMC28666 TaxID=2807626 RepID=UPI00351C4001
MGEAKTGDLVGIYIYKFKYSRQEYLLAYRVPEEQTLVICSAEDAPEQWRSPEFLLMDLYKLGTHENFYDDLKVHLRTNGWYK